MIKSKKSVLFAILIGWVLVLSGCSNKKVEMKNNDDVVALEVEEPEEVFPTDDTSLKASDYISLNVEYDNINTYDFQDNLMVFDADITDYIEERMDESMVSIDSLTSDDIIVLSQGRYTSIEGYKNEVKTIVAADKFNRCKDILWGTLLNSIEIREENAMEYEQIILSRLETALSNFQSVTASEEEYCRNVTSNAVTIDALSERTKNEVDKMLIVLYIAEQKDLLINSEEHESWLLLKGKEKGYISLSDYIGTHNEIQLKVTHQTEVVEDYLCELLGINTLKNATYGHSIKE